MKAVSSRGRRSRRTALVTGLLLVVFLASGIRTQAAERGLYRAGAGSRVQQHDRTFTDSSRGRRVPVRIYRPAGEAERALPLVVFSPGLGASREAYGYLGTNLAGRGFMVAMLTHPGSDSVAWRAGLRADRGNWVPAALDDPANLENRPQDVSFVIDRLTRAGSPFRVDPSRIGVAGHSFGASTAMAVGGMKVDLGDTAGSPRSFTDPRVGAVVAMSPQGTGTMGIAPGAWDGFETPVMLLTGTRDQAPGGRPTRWRRTAFDQISSADRYLVTLIGATHLTFGGRGAVTAEKGAGTDHSVSDYLGDLREALPAGARSRTHHVRVIDALVCAFFDNYLNDRDEAGNWLREYAGERHFDARAEFRPGSSGAGVTQSAD